MLIGLISDTHGLLRNEVFTVFEGVDHILHAGDVGNEEILIELAAIAPVTAVWGNTDGFALRSQLPEVATLELAGWSITVVHGHMQAAARAERMALEFQTDLVVFGHSHTPEVVRVGSVLAVNPGSAGPPRFRQPVAVALATLETTGISTRRVDLVPR
ncbi:MAG: metallophosphatase family protein [Gemmatimonadota bacterium]|jgi:putative phosphoesterase|nr:metallophosphatase family protein [Gemmatimonadota bacterium]